MRFFAMMSGLSVRVPKRLRSEAPRPLQDDTEFSAALQVLETSVYTLHRAAMNQNADAAREALARRKGPCSRMFLKFG